MMCESVSSDTSFINFAQPCNQSTQSDWVLLYNEQLRRAKAQKLETFLYIKMTLMNYCKFIWHDNSIVVMYDYPLGMRCHNVGDYLQYFRVGES